MYNPKKQIQLIVAKAHALKGFAKSLKIISTISYLKTKNTQRKQCIYISSFEVKISKISNHKESSPFQMATKTGHELEIFPLRNFIHKFFAKRPYHGTGIEQLLRILWLWMRNFKELNLDFISNKQYSFNLNKIWKWALWYERERKYSLKFFSSSSIFNDRSEQINICTFSSTGPPTLKIRKNKISFVYEALRPFI